MPLQLILFRHAEAVDAVGGAHDHERVLTPRGEKQAASTARQLVAAGYEPSLALVSDAARTLGTWLQAQPFFPHKAELQARRDIYTGGVASLIKTLAGQEARRHATVILVGHNPHISNLGSDLAGEDLRFHKGDALVFKHKAGSWEEGMNLLGDWELARRCHPAEPK